LISLWSIWFSQCLIWFCCRPDLVLSFGFPVPWQVPLSAGRGLRCRLGSVLSPVEFFVWCFPSCSKSCSGLGLDLLALILVLPQLTRSASVRSPVAASVSVLAQFSLVAAWPTQFFSACQVRLHGSSCTSVELQYESRVGLKRREN
jgi:hypothetical protein